ncbi:NAD(P)-binding protein [Neoconidiobolus thromboides FSU 785]|nr:NAD(P)-binding protein [Neoconidiobolus thromboides FSU 785]
MTIGKNCAIITGGSSGFGKALTLFLANKGIKVIVGDVDIKGGKELETEVNKEDKKIVFCECDVTKEEDLIYLFEQANVHFGGAQIIVNNAGIGPSETFTTSTSTIDPILDINLRSVLKGTSLAIQHFEQQKSQNPQPKQDFCIINVASFAGLRPTSILPIYSITKGGVIYVTKLMGYLNEQGIRVNAVAPSFSPTKIIEEHLEKESFKQKIGLLGGFVPIDKVVDTIYKLIENKEYYGDVIALTPNSESLLPKDNLQAIFLN